MVVICMGWLFYNLSLMCLVAATLFDTKFYHAIDQDKVSSVVAY